MSHHNKKLLTFGCSFTSYDWSTWADILGREFEHFTNHGMCGAGNTYIFNQVMQSVALGEIDKSSTVIIMWSNVIREDRWVKGSWISPGCIYNQSVYSKEFMEYVDPAGLYIRDCAHIAAVTHALENVGCSWHFLSMMPLDNVKEYLTIDWVQKLLKQDTVSEYNSVYAKYLDCILPSVFDVVYKGNWYNRRDDLVKDKSWYTNICKQHDFPTIENMNLKYLQQLDESTLYKLCQKLYASSAKEIIDFKLWERIDHHPTPGMHLEYLQKVLPQFTISEENIQRVIDEDSTLSK